jgi:L-ascorbate metabolism protein UlaG (beta-lactamase superfamily)
MNYKVTFLNHASFSIETDNSITLVDPWYFGRIFNNSWSLLKDTDDSKIDYSKVKYISVSHENTLKQKLITKLQLYFLVELIQM